MLQHLRQESLASVTLLWLVTVGLIVPSSAWATRPVDSGPIEEVAFPGDGAAQTLKPDRGVAYILQPDDDAMKIAAGLIARARQLKTNVVRVHIVRGPEDDPRLLTILRELEQAKIDLHTNIIDLAQAANEVDRVSAITVNSGDLRKTVEAQGALLGEVPDYENAAPAGKQGDAALYGANPLARLLLLPSKVVSLGEALLGMPAKLFRWGMTKLTGQKFKSITSFVVEPVPGNPDGARLTVGKGWVKNSLYTATLAVVMIWANTYLMGPMFSDSDEFKFAKLSERGYHSMIHISYNVFLWVFATLAIAGPITAWKDQVVRLRYDKNAEPGSQVRVEPNGYINFAMGMLLETIFNVMLPAIGYAFNGMKDGTLFSLEELTKLFWSNVWLPVTALFSVFSFAVPQNLFGRWLNTADVLSKSAKVEDRQRAARYRLYAGVGSFCFWTFLFSTAVNLARFLPKDKSFVSYFPESLTFLNEYLAWIPASAAPLLLLGTAGFAWQYGRGLSQGVKSLLRGGWSLLTGKRKDPEFQRADQGCAIFMMDAEHEPSLAVTL